MGEEKQPIFRTAPCGTHNVENLWKQDLNKYNIYIYIYIYIHTVWLYIYNIWYQFISWFYIILVFIYPKIVVSWAPEQLQPTVHRRAPSQDAKYDPEHQWSSLQTWPIGRFFSGVKQRWEIISQMMKNPPYGNTVVKNIMGIYYCLYLVGGIPTPLKNMKVNGKDDIPYIMDNKIHVPNHQPAIVYCLSDCVMEIMIIMGPLINVMVPYHWIFFDAYDRHRTQPLPGDQLTPHLQRAEEEPSKVSRTRQTYRRGPFWCHRHLFPYGDLWCLCKMHHVIWIKWR